MPGTAAGARKGWKVRRAIRPKTMTLKAGIKKAQIYADQANALARTKFAGGLNIRIEKIDEEYQTSLRDTKSRIDVYQKMGNDAKIAAQLRGNILPLISAVRWKVEGGTQEMQDLVRQNLLREGDPRYWCETSWTQRLLEKLQCLQFGFALHGKEWDVVDGYRIIRRLVYLQPKSLGGPLGAWEWDKEGKRLVAIHRRYRLPLGNQINDERIPIEDIDASVWWMTGDNMEGAALIRPMYGAWIKKDLASKIGMIALMNGGVGIPMATAALGDGDKAIKALSTIAGDLRGGSKERQFITLLNGQKMELMVQGGNIVDARPMVQEQNMDIAAAGAMDFMQAGQTSSGSRAGGSVMMVSYMQQLDAVREWLQEQINHGAGYLVGQVEDLIYANFNPASVKECPRIVGSRVSPTEQLDNLPLLGDLTQKLVLPRARKLANAALDRLGYPTLTQQEWDESVGPRSVVDVAGQPGPTHPTIMPPVGPGEKALPQGNGGAGRPNEVVPTDVQNPRKDKAGRAFGLTQDPGQKKTPGASPRPRSAASYLWLRSTLA